MDKETVEKMNNVEAIKTFFERNGGKKITMADLKALSSEDRAELATLAKAELVKSN